MPRFYVDFALSPDSVVELPDNVVRHLNVLRVKNTEEIVLFNGNGKSYPALPEVLEKRRASVRILREEATDNESPLNITLVQAVSTAERMDFTCKKRGIGRGGNSPGHQRTLCRALERRAR